MLNATDATQVTFLGEFVSRGRRWNAYSDGTVLPVIAGGDGTGDAGAGAGAGGAAGAATDAGATGGQGGTGERTFTQTDLNATVAREAEKAKTAALQQVATDLGVSLDEAKQIIADRRSADDAKKSEAERAADAWKAAQAAAEQIKSATERERHEARLERALGRAGLDTGNDILRRAGLAALDVPLDADDAAVTAAIEQAKKDAPQLFAATTTTTTGGGGQHTDTGGQTRSNTTPPGDFGAKGAAEAARRWGKDAKTA